MALLATSIMVAPQFSLAENAYSIVEQEYLKTFTL